MWLDVTRLDRAWCVMRGPGIGGEEELGRPRRQDAVHRRRGDGPCCRLVLLGAGHVLQSAVGLGGKRGDGPCIGHMVGRVEGGGRNGATVWVGEWCVRCEGRGGMIHASCFCCVGLGMRSGAPRGMGEADKGVPHGAARGSCWNDGLGVGVLETERRVVLGMKGWAIAGTRCSGMVRPGISSVPAPCGKGRLMSCTTACTRRLVVVCGVGVRVIGRFLAGTFTWGLCATKEGVRLVATRSIVPYPGLFVQACARGKGQDVSETRVGGWIAGLRTSRASRERGASVIACG